MVPYLTRKANAAQRTYDVVVYGGTISGILAAYAAKRDGLNAALVIGPNPLGGMPANGLSRADLQSTGHNGGLVLEFYRRIGHHYGLEYGFNYEPHVAHAIAISFLTEANIPVYTSQLGHADKINGKITAIRLLDKTTLYALYWIDASYEGDLMAAAAVTYRTGREGQSAYNEPLAGYGVGQIKHTIKTHSTSGKLLPGLILPPSNAVGGADEAVMAYTYRLCITDKSANRIPFPKPAGYNPSLYALRLEELSATKVFLPGAALPNGKYDLNNGAWIMGVDYVMGNWNYPTTLPGIARSNIVRNHTKYVAGLLYFLANDPAVPPSYRKSTAAFGLCADEFIDNQHWPRQLYVRECRRLLGRYTLVQRDVQTGTIQPDPIGVAFYAFDSHATMRIADGVSHETSDGQFSLLSASARAYKPYQIPYRSLTPLAADATNLLVTVCASASRVAYTSLRIEHHYMIMGEAAGVAIAVALRSGKAPVQNVSVSELRSKLLSHGVVLDPMAAPAP
jgi:hypothetical protein